MFEAQAQTGSGNSNIIFDPIRGRKIQISTIHKVKGETHDATLYLETVNNRKSENFVGWEVYDCRGK
jgi:hypothetical protein